jgi:hypothetical protein
MKSLGVSGAPIIDTRCHPMGCSLPARISAATSPTWVAITPSTGDLRAAPGIALTDYP